MSLASILFSLISTTCMGVAVTATLVAGAVSLPAILTAAAAGFVLALPITRAVARALDR